MSLVVSKTYKISELIMTVMLKYHCYGYKLCFMFELYLHIIFRFFIQLFLTAVVLKLPRYYTLA